MEHICKNCGALHSGAFCNHCGQKVINERFKLKVIVKDAIETTFNLDKGFFFTINQLICNPKKVIKDYLSGRTIVYTNPIKFLIVIAGISALILVATNSIDRNMQMTNNLFAHEDYSPRMLRVAEIIKSYVNIIMMILVPFFTFSFKLFFLRKELNYTEHLIINCYSFGMAQLITILPNIIYSFIPVLPIVGMLSGFGIQLTIYSYFYYKLTSRNLFGTVFSSFLSMIIGFLLMMVVLLSLMYIIIILLKGLSII